MKRLFILVAALVSSFAFGATLVPVQLLNPTGSSSGQAIVSTGASSAPAWGGIGVNGIAAIAANTVLANATNSSASPTAFAMPSCSTSASALNWTTSTGFTCNTAVNAAQLGGQTFTSPTITTPTINGVTNGSAAAAGSVGQPLTNTSGAISLSNNTATNTATVTLTAGDWDVYGSCSVVGVASTSITATACGLSSTSATLPAGPLASGLGSSTGLTGGAYENFEAPPQLFNVSSSTPVWTVCSANFTVSTATCTGYIFARRRH